MLPQRQGTLIFTGATASVRRAAVHGIRLGQSGFESSCTRLCSRVRTARHPRAHVIIDGVIRGDYAQTQFADLARSKGEDGLLEPDAIADAYWALHRQSKTAWTHELDPALSRNLSNTAFLRNTSKEIGNEP